MLHHRLPMRDFGHLFGPSNWFPINFPVNSTIACEQFSEYLSKWIVDVDETRWEYPVVNQIHIFVTYIIWTNQRPVKFCPFTLDAMPAVVTRLGEKRINPFVENSLMKSIPVKIKKRKNHLEHLTRMFWNKVWIGEEMGSFTGWPETLFGNSRLI